MNRAIGFFLVSSIFFSGQVNSQSLFDDAGLQQKFNYQVKQLSQFMERFNYIEKVKPLNGMESSKILNLVSLINAQDTGLVYDPKTIEFLKIISNDSSDFTISYADTNWFAIAKGIFSYQGKDILIDITLRQQGEIGKGYRWRIEDVSSSIFSFHVSRDSLKKFINPMNHEIGFTELSKAINEKEGISAYASKVSDDFLTTFLIMVQNGDIKLKQINSTEFIFFQIPGWVFTVKNFNRLDNNSGWLIASLKKMDLKQKEEFENKGFSSNFFSVNQIHPISTK